MDYIMEEENLGEQGFLVALLKPVKDDIREIEDAANVYPLKIDYTSELESIKVIDMTSKKMKYKEWFYVKLYIPKTDSYVYAIYPFLQDYKK